MRCSLLLRGLLASAVAFASSRAATVATAPFNCGVHTGSLLVEQQKAGTPVTDNARIGWVGTVAGFNGFRFVGNSESAPRATFTFTGCQGGPPVKLFCTNCEPPDQTVVGNYPTAFDASGEPNQWEFMNFGLPASINFPIGGGQDPDQGHFWASTDFTFGLDGLIRPVTYSTSNTNQGLMCDLWCAASTCTIFQWRPAPLSNTFYRFLWQGT